MNILKYCFGFSPQLWKVVQISQCLIWFATVAYGFFGAYVYPYRMVRGKGEKTACEKEKELKLITSVRFMGFSNITRDGLGSFFCLWEPFWGYQIKPEVARPVANSKAASEITFCKLISEAANLGFSPHSSIRN